LNYTRNLTSRDPFRGRGNRLHHKSNGKARQLQDCPFPLETACLSEQKSLGDGEIFNLDAPVERLL